MSEQRQQVQTSYPYWMAFNAGLTGVAGQRIPSETPAASVDVRMLGGMTNLVTSKARLADFSEARLGASGPLRSSGDVPVVAMFGKRDSAEPVKLWRGRPLVRKGRKLRAEVYNVGPETGGYLVIVGRPEQADRPVIEMPDDRPHQYVTVNAGLDGGAEKTTEGILVGGFSYDALITGAITDMAAASIGIRIVDHRGAPWCEANSYVPLWSVAGRASGHLCAMTWPAFYFLPRGETFTVGFQNAVAADTPESNGTVTFEMMRLS